MKLKLKICSSSYKIYKIKIIKNKIIIEIEMNNFIKWF